MPRPASGTLQRDGDRWLARVTLGAGTRRAFVLASTSETAARERLAVLARLAAALRAGGAPVEIGARVLALVAEREGAALTDAIAAAECIARGGAAVSASLTFGDVARSWISGELHQRFPDHVGALRGVATRRSILDRHLLPAVGDVPIVAFSLDDAQRALDALPSSLAPSSRGDKRSAPNPREPRAIRPPSLAG